MNIIETKVLPSGQEVLYLFDERTGRAIKVLVDDYTGLNVQDAYAPPVVPSVRRTPPTTSRTEMEKPQQPAIELDADGTTTQDMPGMPLRPKPSIIPPGLGGLFIDKEDPRADKVTRRV
jgi:hypothetical protein